MNKDIKTRDEIIFGKYEPNLYAGGYRGFEKMELNTLKELVDKGFADLDECQNSSPSIEEFINFMESHDGFVVNGYAISDDRLDYRVTVTTILATDECDNSKNLKDFVDAFREADDFYSDKLYAWWD